MSEEENKEKKSEGKSLSASVIDTAENIKKLRKIVEEETAKDNS